MKLFFIFAIFFIQNIAQAGVWSVGDTCEFALPDGRNGELRLRHLGHQGVEIVLKSSTPYLSNQHDFYSGFESFDEHKKPILYLNWSAGFGPAELYRWTKQLVIIGLSPESTSPKNW